MNPSEQEKLTADELEMADLLLEAIDLSQYSEVELEMMGESGTLHYGLGRCLKHFVRLNPDFMESSEALDSVRSMAVAKLIQVGAMEAA